ncbi:MAG: carboxypeptidase-like regulatory domain-containing protein, partial [Odoribacter sp.]|nr:carboxypeptidase-like regulatory domain-containing protein [Odoribacter sp.]
MKKNYGKKAESGNFFRSGHFWLRMLLFAVWLGLPGLLAAQQTVTFRMEKATLKQALQVLKEKSGVNFVYNTQDVDDRTVVSVAVEGKSVEEALDMVLASTPYVYERVKDYFLIKKGNKQPADTKTVKGIVRDEHGQPMPGVNVMIEGTYVGQSTNEKGEFVMPGMIEGATLVFSFIGYEEVKKTVGAQTEIEVKLVPVATEMDEVVVTGMF